MGKFFGEFIIFKEESRDQSVKFPQLSYQVHCNRLRNYQSKEESMNLIRQLVDFDGWISALLFKYNKFAKKLSHTESWSQSKWR